MRAGIIFALGGLDGFLRDLRACVRRDEHFDILRAADHVGIGDDVAFGIDDYAGADGAAAADDQVGLAAFAVFGGSRSR